MTITETERIEVVKRPDIKILVVDDREDNLLSIETILDKDGYTIQTANSGRAALKALLKEQDYTLILMDVQMPDLNGFETATLIYERKILQHIPIIFITANDFNEDSVFKGYEMGGVDYISKPINPNLLRAKVSVFVDLYTKNHQLIAQDNKLTVVNTVLAREIEERKTSEEKVRLLNKQLMENIIRLQSTNEELERFAYIASHDLQEPLRKIIMFGDMLDKKYSSFLNDEGRNYLDRMTKASKRMQLLIDNLLALSRSVFPVNTFQETDMFNLVKEVITDLETYIQQKKAKISVSHLPKINIIPDQFHRLIQNLLINAIKFSKEDATPEIYIYSQKVKGADIESITPDKYDDDYLQICIKDNGIGFEQQYADQIFVIFKRLHTYDHIEGTGIGLSICKKIVEQHNGYISAKGIVNEGATFTISLPIKQSKEQPLIPVLNYPSVNI